MKNLDRAAMTLCQLVHSTTGGRPQRWMSLHTAGLQLGLDLERAEQVARHAASRDWLQLNPGPVLHSVAIAPTLLLALPRP